MGYVKTILHQTPLLHLMPCSNKQEARKSHRSRDTSRIISDSLFSTATGGKLGVKMSFWVLQILLQQFVDRHTPMLYNKRLY